ncbi:E3 ubiquitin-protein ligase SSM4 KNAG_0H02810 [Huiozyma naganishii CBS 8797]|uniref:RING-type E3 ubiquitin transferase n=1 Tax=Huiozyma naganishii (strain ATCC MYA-139 / BCRC 22969 / CBS 8797 / KCTC 17520 / NBRC 10181 / NCYC 3082 / Yp74L-3) TaxID=1071383 RepID=J7S9T4_HUIN7|nr:hypothetical protein KNAG_0H02810 [Kazachstania naganishii CBS 8797]CCK71696.1 hypothetical protein KNAG_0H02810 [Kazachstania naganishii CBS 8797]
MSSLEGSGALSGATCRICRGEATDDNPLFHPCKCKGSIKYLHEPCLLEWIEARNIDINDPHGAAIYCDICHHPFQFKTTYAETMPEKIPLRLLLTNTSKLYLIKLKNTVLVTFALGLLVGGTILAWNVSGKLYTFVLDGKLPYKNEFFKSLWFGYSEDMTTNRDKLAFKFTTAGVYQNIPLLVTALLENIKFSVSQIGLLLLLHLALYFQYDMIVREDVFGKMVFHKIGPSYSLEDYKNRLRERFPDVDDEMLEQVARIMRNKELLKQEDGDDLDAEVDVGDVGDVVADRHELDELVHNGELDASLEDRENEEEEENLGPDSANDESDHSSIHSHDDSFTGLRLPEERPPEFAENPFEHPLRPVQPPNPIHHHEPEEPRIQLADVFAGGADIQQPQLQQQDLEDEAAMQNEPDQGGAPFVMLLKLRFSTVLLYFLLAVVIINAYAFVSYFVPTVIGYQLLNLYLGTIKTIGHGISTAYRLSGLRNLNNNVAQKVPILSVIETWIETNVFQNAQYYYNCYRDGSLDYLTEVRLLPGLVTYSTFVALLCVASEFIRRGYNRTHGMTNKKRRLVFQILFAIRCTFKVFTLFFIELAGFPILAGVMLDISLIAPILGSPTTWLWVTQVFKFWSPMSYIIYWAIGTLYMYWFAKYIGMIRQYIIRPGVLFFIRSPDDPNIKILHDSLIHPMSIQLSRLCLSMFIYAVFIIAGFGIHTRLLFPYVFKTRILDAHPLFSTIGFVNVGTMILGFIIAKNLIEENPNVKALVRHYWMTVMTIIARKLRLSSFILGKDYALERGHVLYRNSFYHFFATKTAQWSNPDLFSNPKTVMQARTLFKENKDIHAYFVPDGTLMRVPSSDIVSRNYVQTMFLPVTKDDKLLKPLDLKRIKERNRRNAGEFAYLDHQNTDFDDYFICYVPPHFKLRYMTLIGLMWLFASILIFSIAVLSQYTTNTLSAVVLPVLWMSGFHDKLTAFKTLIREGYRQCNFQYTSFGAIILSLALDFYKEHDLSRYFFSEVVVEDGDANGGNEGDEEQPVVANAPNVNLNPAVPRQRAFDLIFENFVMKSIVFSLLNFLGGFLVTLTVSVMIYFLRYTAAYATRTALEFAPSLKKYTMLSGGGVEMFKTLVFVLSIFWFVFPTIKSSGQLIQINNQRFADVIKMIWGLNLAAPVKNLCKAFLFITVVVGGPMVYEFYFSSTKYRSFLDAMYFIKLRTPMEHYQDMTTSMHYSSMIVCLATLSVAIYHFVHIMRFWFGKAVQDVKDQVYAKGRSLENYENVETS